MVEDRVTDGRRIGQLLASELAGRDDGPLGRVTVVDADSDAGPSPDGTVAYGVALRDERVADVLLFPESVEIRLVSRDPEAVLDAVRGQGLHGGRRADGLDPESAGSGAVEESGTDSTRDSGSVVVRVEYGAAVKRAVDALVAGFDG